MPERRDYPCQLLEGARVGRREREMISIQKRIRESEIRDIESDRY